jgi:hypothetical protein
MPFAFPIANFNLADSAPTNRAKALRDGVSQTVPGFYGLTLSRKRPNM